MQPTQSVFVDARVGAFSTAAPGAVEHGSQLHLTRSGKRSYRRAYGRACRMGGTPYKGRWRPWTWFERRQLQPQFVGRRQDMVLPTTDSWRTFTWNAGGLTTNIFQELETYVRERHYDIICVQETKWRHDSTWTNKVFHYIHSQGFGKEDRVAGLLTMISTKLVKAEDIQYVAAHPGRLLHVRIPRGQSSVDIVNWYQYSVSDAEGVFDRRLSLLAKLQKCVAGLPQRSSFLLAGDFNCPVSPNPPVCGSCVLTPTSTRYKDAKDLHKCAEHGPHDDKVNLRGYVTKGKSGELPMPRFLPCAQNTQMQGEASGRGGQRSANHR